MSNEQTDKKALWDSWQYEFKAWVGMMQSVPVALIVSKDHSESYEMDRRHIFKLENGQYAFVKESGCSCYEPEKAEIALARNLKEAKQFWNKTIDAETWNDAWKSERL